MVGFSVLPQQTPFAVIDAPPSSDITPPLMAVVAVMLDTGVVDKEGMVAGSSFLQAVASNTTIAVIINGK